MQFFPSSPLQWRVNRPGTDPKSLPSVCVWTKVKFHLRILRLRRSAISPKSIIESAFSVSDEKSIINSLHFMIWRCAVPTVSQAWEFAFFFRSEFGLSERCPTSVAFVWRVAHGAELFHFYFSFSVSFVVNVIDDMTPNNLQLIHVLARNRLD